jgi:hypothetical protein
MTKRACMVLALRHAAGLAALLAVGVFVISAALAPASVAASAPGTAFSAEGGAAMSRSRTSTAVVSSAPMLLTR